MMDKKIFYSLNVLDGAGQKCLHTVIHCSNIKKHDYFYFKRLVYVWNDYNIYK